MTNWLVSILIVLGISSIPAIVTLTLTVKHGYELGTPDYIGMVCVALFLISCVFAVHEVTFGGGK
ncbi:hypothetical protein CPT_Moonbeam149 [Bacillus phage Moonbeam]|uniref:Uncharacterized protein n=1 Tax=Bacillus phage Moonbeam TaxID=1540091 RepID=A0A0A0RNG7_9CAUD|nr:hypothetical protein CPT_Moonbeam149 [Bacillus phage Moonbeam]AIW03547.1 hypothetical protein CPT_Moonbeam149 [Bacillus phage Moonbeam]